MTAAINSATRSWATGKRSGIAATTSTKLAKARRNAAGDFSPVNRRDDGLLEVDMKRQKSKHMKRPRAWHHLPNQDRKFRRAIKILDEAMKPREEPDKEDA